MPRRGFSLIELLVVISVISLLVSILMPCLSHAKRYAREVRCRTSLKALGVGWRMYMDDYPSAVPVASSLPVAAADISLVTTMREQVDHPTQRHESADQALVPGAIAEA